MTHINQKILKKLRHNQGETLIYTILVMAILIIVGSALAAFAVMSIRLSTLQHASEKAFYLSDAAMEETLTQLESQLREAETNAVEYINQTSNYYSQPKWQAFLQKINQDSVNGIISSGEASERIKMATKAEFFKQYYYELFDKPSGETWLTQDYSLLNASNGYIDSPMPVFNAAALPADSFKNLEQITLDPTVYTGFEATSKPLMAIESSFKDNYIQLKLSSTGQFNDYKKPIIVRVSLVPPDYTQVVNTRSGTMTVSKNDILGYGLIARMDIIATEGENNTVNGSVYSYGTFPETGGYRISQLGGVMLGYKASSNILNQKIGDFDPSLTNSAGSLTVNGNLYTRSAVRLFSDNSNLTVTGNVYANALTFDEQSRNADATINRNLYLYEDLYLAGQNPTLIVGESTAKGDGLLWGIMQHQVNLSNQVVRSDMSSSIIVDSDSISPRIFVNSAYIAGVAYFNVYRDSQGTRQYYQSGESFTTNNNFYFYDTKSPGNTDLTTTAVAYTDENGKMYYLYEALDASGNVVSNVQFKADVFYQGGLKDPSSISAADRSIFNVRSLDIDADGDIIGLENNYALGVIIANSKVIDPYPEIGGTTAPKSEYANDAAFQGMKRSVLKAADQMTSLLSTRDYTTNRNQDPSMAASSRLGQYIQWPATDVIKINDPAHLAIVSKDPSINVYVNIPENTANTIRATEPNSIFLTQGTGAYRNSKGVIAVNGNVVIYNDDLSHPFNYEGTIISNGSIVLRGLGEKTFSYNEALIYDLIAKDTTLKSVFSLDSGKKLTLQQVNGVDSSSENGSLTFSVTSNADRLTIDAGQIPESGGMMKKQTEFSFKINGWSISD